MTRAGLAQPVTAGVVAALVGFTSSFAVVLTGLRSVGATADDAASGLLVLSLTMGLGTVLFCLVTRTPVTMAWSTPGAALLAGAGIPEGGYATAVTAFLIVGLLYLATALVTPFARWVRAIPVSLANAMLAGILLTLCVEPFRALADRPAAIAPILATWLVLLRVARRWAVPGAFAAAVVVIAVTGALGSVDPGQLVPTLTWTSPGLHLGRAVALAIPLYLVTMTSQNIPGIAVLGAHGFDTPMRPAMTYTGAATVLTAPLGGFSINLSAITAALTAGPGGHPDPHRRWIAGLSMGVTYLLLGPLAATVVAISAAAPDGVLATVAGAALLGAFGSSAATALADVDRREAAALAFVVAASGLTIAGVGAAFWALLAGGVLLAVLGVGRRPASESAPQPAP